MICCKFSLTFILVVSFKSLISDVSANTHENFGKEEIFLPGDILLGGLFMLNVACNTSTKSAPCTTDSISRSGYQEMQAMLMAVNEVNRKEWLLPGISLGVHIKDTCGEVNTAVREALNFSFVRGHMKEHTSCPGLNRTPIATISNASHFENETIAIIGPTLSETARAVADLAGLFDVPVVSQSATSVVLGDRKRFGHFFRTVPTDSYLAKVVVDLMLHYKWNFFILLTSDDEYGRSGRRAFRTEIVKHMLCTDMDEVVTTWNMATVVSKVKMQAKAKIIVSFLTDSYLIKMLNESKAQNLSPFVWLLSDTWTTAQLTTRHKDLVTNPMIGTGPVQFEDEWFRHELVEATNKSSSLWARSFSCFEKAFCQRKTLSECICLDNYEVSPYVGPTFDAVYAVAAALHAHLGCSEQSCLRHASQRRRRKLADRLREVTFTSITGRNVSFDKEGAANYSYQIVKFHRASNALRLVQVANWSLHSKGNSSNGVFHWITEEDWLSFGNTTTISNCSRNCMPGEYKTPQKLHPNCCWYCERCAEGTISSTVNSKKCRSCLRGFSPNQNRTTCTPIHNSFIEWNGTVSVAIIAISAVGMALVFLTLAVFALHKDTPIVKAAIQCHSYLQLTGVVFFLLLPLLFVGKPSEITCDLKPFLVGFCLSYNVGSILVKTNRIARSFNGNAYKSNGSAFKRHIVVIFLIVIMEELICLLWVLTLNRPHLETFIMSPRESSQTCVYGNSSKGVALWCSYNAGLILVTTYQAILVRKAKCNYNESKFLFFTMVSWCVTILVYIPVFIGISGYIKDIIISFLLIFMGLIEYMCIFVPKLYIIILRPQKNVPR